ncbi:MAG: DNA methyltransferase [Phenylobacterium sp.]|uniref:site-specific DNA-methyltransferase n=1 Tax=Phenylobacterium sp. TaxID=1871053 RepID=UPI00272234EF|nr:DNA methyltransferase [Phenylobacterium sp.]MDO8912757.1 DNA methyltransferase [Phenylobacterium sp.]MDP3102023.1 DNA methyltransferase [Phenylobacterium sp.]
MPNPIRVRDRKRAQSTASPAALKAGAPSLGAEPKFICEPIDNLKPAQNRIRKHPKRQVEILVRNIRRFGVVIPVLVTQHREIIDGHLIWEACKRLGHKTIPVTVVAHLSEAEIKALRISISAIAGMSEWDDPALALELDFVCKVDPLLVSFTALPTARVDQLLLTGLEKKPADDEAPPPPRVPISRRGDFFTCARHRFGCGDATDPADISTVMGPHKAQMFFSDFPYGVSIAAISSGHSEFLKGSKMTPEEARDLFERALAAGLPFVDDGAGAFLFIDHRSMAILTQAAEAAGLRHLCTAVWDKTAGNRGSPYKHQVEFVLVLVKGDRLAIDNVEMGRHGRERTTLWTVPGYARFGPGRQEAVEAHPTVKPVSLLTEAILDVTDPGHVILDPFLGSGSLLAAAHRTGRIGIGLELDPKFVDVIVRRIEAVTGEPAIHEETGLTFAELAAQRADQTASQA